MFTCPTIIKGKKKGQESTCGAELQTKRTLANGTKVRRERYCPKCGARIWTVEQFETDMAAAEMKRTEQTMNLAQQIRDLNSRIGEYESFFIGLRTVLGNVGK